MPLADFLSGPTNRSHTTYERSLLTTTAAENANGEVLLGSVYRKLLLGIGEGSIDLTKISDLKDKLDTCFTQVNSQFEFAGLAQTLLLAPGGIASPQKEGQKDLRRLHSMMPIVPQVARHACVIGQVRSRWNPGNLLLQVVGAGLGEAQGNALLGRLTSSLLITENDDLFARFLAEFLERAAPSGGALPQCQLDAEDRRGFRGTAPSEGMSPAERFCQDLESVLALKDQLTRRQWCVLLEAVLRLGLASHVLWVCRANATCWRLALDAADGRTVPPAAEIEAELWVAHRGAAPLIEIGQPAEQGIKRILESYLAARFGLNILLCRLEDRGQLFGGTIGFEPSRGIAAAEEVRAFLLHVSANRLLIDPLDPAAWLRQECSDCCDAHASHLSTKIGPTKNLREFAIYSLGQMQTTPPESRSYDQSYLLTSDQRSTTRKRHLAHPGPAMLIFLTHACCRTQGDLPVSLEDFRLHLNDYGLHTPAGELTTGKLCLDLQNLGLVVDSPDAAGGRLLVRPF